MSNFLALTDTKTAVCQRLASQSKRIGVLLIKHKSSQSGLLACLDDLLGSVYNLFYATHFEYADRLKTLSEHDIGNVAIRANDMGQCKVRIDGKWAAGVFFNNALFRLAGVYHRVLKIAVDKPTSRDFPYALLPEVEKLFRAATKLDWKHTHIQAIYKEVTDLKHTPDGIFEGRSVRFVQAIDAVDEILTLVEALC
jgi:hypothetical protein